LRPWMTSHPSSWPSFSICTSLQHSQFIQDIIYFKKKHSRSSTKSTFFGLRPDSTKRIRNNSHKKINKPEIEHDDGSNEEKTRDEVFCVDHVIH
jgi:hypothetical protein